MPDSLHTIRILKKPDIIDMAGEKAMIDLESGNYFVLTGAANDIWDEMKDGIRVDAIEDALMRVYEVDAETCRAAVREFLSKLESFGFIRLEPDA